MRKKAKPAPPKVGDVIAVRFLDHHEKSDEAYEYEVFGRLAVLNRTSYVIDCWANADPCPEKRIENKENILQYAIVKKAVLKVEVLRRA